jgi:molybdenum cofactor synthesis domain-containing protein
VADDERDMRETTHVAADFPQADHGNDTVRGILRRMSHHEQHEHDDASPKAAILTVSDSRSRGAAVDETRAQLEQVLEHAGWSEPRYAIVEDDRAQISAAIVELCETGCSLVLTTGGTGLGPRDVTPEATLDVIDRAVPGIPELLRSEGATSTKMSWLSRAVAGQRGATLIVNLPGSPRGACDGARVLLPLVAHALHVTHGGGHDA